MMKLMKLILWTVLAVAVAVIVSNVVGPFRGLIRQLSRLF